MALTLPTLPLVKKNSSLLIGNPSTTDALKSG